MASRLELNHKIHVLTKREELDTVRVAGKVVIVLDILFATTTMVAALANGAREVLPVLDEAAARNCLKDQSEADCVLAGELMAETLPGFAHPAPLALLEHGIRGKSVIYSTTNGTVAMTQASGGARVYCGALLNAGALVRHIARHHAGETVLIVCSGSANNFNLEDFVGAGAFVARFRDVLGEGADFSDAAKAALATYRGAKLPQTLLDCRVGRLMARKSLVHEVEFACREDEYDIIPVLENGRLRPAS
jgi:2-phosphosulfolactate phosphatase